jgi:hypothetical protein
VVAPGHDVVLDAAVVDVEEAGAAVPVPTVPGSAVPLPHDARTLAATTAVTIITCLIGSHGFTNTLASSEHPRSLPDLWGTTALSAQADHGG